MFFREIPFHLWGASHGIPVLFFIILGTIIILYGQRLTNRQAQKRLLLIISFIPFVSFCLFVMMQIATGVFSIKNDLPIFICRFLALTAPIVYWKENKFWTGVFYFWILAGTLNAVITADLRFDYPHWNYFIYFAMHCALIILPIYYCVVLKHRIALKDLWNGYWTANVFILVTMIINFTIESNYMFTREKPLVASLLDHLGPWPWYIVAVQFIALVLFGLLYLPFLRRNKQSTTS